MSYGTLCYLLYALYRLSVMSLQKEKRKVSAGYNFSSVLLETLLCQLVYNMFTNRILVLQSTDKTYRETKANRNDHKKYLQGTRTKMKRKQQ